MTFGSSELIYVAGSPLPIMIEEFEEEEEEEDAPEPPPQVPPSVPPRTRVARTTSTSPAPLGPECDPRTSASPERALDPRVAVTVPPPTQPAFVEPQPQPQSHAPEPPQTLPRTRRAARETPTVVAPPRMYATISRRKNEPPGSSPVSCFTNNRRARVK